MFVNPLIKRAALSYFVRTFFVKTSDCSQAVMPENFRQLIDIPRPAIIDLYKSKVAVLKTAS
jgi:hypothetical protein